GTTPGAGRRTREADSAINVPAQSALRRFDLRAGISAIPTPAKSRSPTVHRASPRERCPARILLERFHPASLAASQSAVREFPIVHVDIVTMGLLLDVFDQLAFCSHAAARASRRRRNHAHDDRPRRSWRSPMYVGTRARPGTTRSC